MQTRELDKLDLSFDPDRTTFEDPTPSVLDGQWHDAATKLDLAKAYQEMGDVEGARERVGPSAPVVEYIGEWHAHPLFIEAAADRVADAFARLEPGARARAQLIFTAHSIPAAMAAASPYVEQLRESARLIAERLGGQHWALAFQSRSGSPRDPWLEPDVCDVLRGLKGQPAVVAPIGFICDHVEVLYDLDVEATRVARQAGVAMERAATVGEHTRFIQMMAALIRERLSALPGSLREQADG